MSIVVAALYQFKTVEDPHQVKLALDKVCKKAGTLGTLLLANEGINGTVSGSEEGIGLLVAEIKRQGFDALELKYSHANEDPFLRMKIVIKKEIVTLGEEVNPCQLVGEYISSQEWNQLILRDDVLLIDTRNDYEYELGHFKNAVNPDTTCFREFPKYVQSIDRDKYKIIAMYCTGGIRCEKASSYMLKEGFEKVYHLKGGILQYLEDMPKEDSLWFGECFVFDRRVALGHGLEITGYKQCFACRRALTQKDVEHPDYVEGISCHSCIQTVDTDKRQALSERQHQMLLAKIRNTKHIGAE